MYADSKIQIIALIVNLYQAGKYYKIPYTIPCLFYHLLMSRAEKERFTIKENSTSLSEGV